MLCSLWLQINSSEGSAGGEGASLTAPDSPPHSEGPAQSLGGPRALVVRRPGLTPILGRAEARAP